MKNKPLENEMLRIRNHKPDCPIVRKKPLWWRPVHCLVDDVAVGKNSLLTHLQFSYIETHPGKKIVYCNCADLIDKIIKNNITTEKFFSGYDVVILDNCWTLNGRAQTSERLAELITSVRNKVNFAIIIDKQDVIIKEKSRITAKECCTIVNVLKKQNLDLRFYSMENIMVRLKRGILYKQAHKQRVKIDRKVADFIIFSDVPVNSYDEIVFKIDYYQRLGVLDNMVSILKVVYGMQVSESDFMAVANLQIENKNGGE